MQSLPYLIHRKSRHGFFGRQGKRGKKEKAEVQAEAQKLQAESRKLGEESEAKLKPHERLALALTFIQIAIALAAITVLTKRRWLLWGSVAAAAIGMVTAMTAFF
ncbi:DUF4337 family protein [Undibacterium arcticum]